MALGDAFVKNTQVFGDRRDGGYALGEGRVQLFFLRGVLRVQSLAFGGDGLLGLTQRGFRGFQAAIGIFSGHHDFELAVFGLGDFRFGVGNFVLQGFVGFVGFDRAALFAIFLGALFPLLDVEFEFLAFRETVSMGFAGGGDWVTRHSQFQVRCVYTVGKR